MAHHPRGRVVSARAGIALLALALAACGGAKRGEPVAGDFASDEAKVRRGELLFDQHCHKCHTGGEAALGPSLNDKPLPKFAMHLQTRAGVGAMPGFSEKQLSDEEVDAITSYLKALRHHRKD
jgi:mono/diheme cytochrome c family protein